MREKAKEHYTRLKEKAAVGSAYFRHKTRLRAHGFLDLLLSFLLSPWKTFKLICFLVGFQVIVMTSVMFGYFYNFFDSLPDIKNMQFSELQSRAEKRVFEKLDSKEKKYKWVELKDINRGLLYAIVYSEDSTFFEHGGFNVEAIVDSLAENLKERRAVRGASTISQQVAKNVFLTQEKTLIRKLKEFVLTWQLENRFDKNEILEVYLNIAEFGPDIFGVNAASYHYYNAPPKYMNAAQGAFLGQMLPSPRKRYYAIWAKRTLNSKYRKRIDRVLRDLRYEEFITDDEYRRFTQYRYFESPRQPARR